MAANPDTNIHRLWHDQPREEHQMSLDEIRVKAKRFESRTRRWRNVGNAAVILVAVGSTVEALWPGQGIIERTGDLLTVAAVLYIAFEFRKHRRLTTMPEGRGLTSCIDFYRAQLTEQRNLTRQSSRFLLPFVPGITLSLLGDALYRLPTANVIGIAAVGVALFLGVAWLNARTARTLQREIDALEGIAPA